ncbi:CopD family protein [Xanthomonas campestris pv. campestris]|nr:CopD family protein [Xanthomonas campestris pv. campestris]MEB2057177.1 CopD family protein [Xanthomonas campestris pv. campestris]
MTLYLWIKTFHLLFVIAWMAAVFYLPRILVNIAEAGTGTDTAVRARLVLMGRRLYKFGHSMLGLALLLGAVLWLGYRVIPDFPTMVAGGWLHAKLFAVALILAHYIVAGRWLKGVDQGRALPSGRALRLFNEVPVVLLVGVIWLVLAKPF